MEELTDAQKAEYFRRSYTSVDGLWFMKVEELHGFEEALEIDRRVWSVLPKIQARTLMKMLGAEKGIAGLKRCLAAKHTLERFEFEAEADIETEDGGCGLIMTITKCPWHELIAKSGRGELSERVGSTICNAEYSTWALEFGEGGDQKISFSLESQICKGDKACVFRFEESRAP